MGFAYAVSGLFATISAVVFWVIAWQTWTGVIYFAARPIRKKERPVIFWSISTAILLFTGLQSAWFAIHLVEQLSGDR